MAGTDSKSTIAMKHMSFCKFPVAFILFTFCMVGTAKGVAYQTNQSSLKKSTESASPIVLAHYMPWFEADKNSKQFGWHWTMNHFDPNQVESDGQREIASHHSPLIGPYSSNDPNVIEYHLLTMKISGIEGVIIDWYGLSDLYDYPVIHRNTTALVEQIKRFKMKFAICYEDKTVKNLIQQRRLDPDKMTDHVIGEVNWLNKHWFQTPEYVKLDRRPVLLSFGYSGLSDQQWTDTVEKLSFPIAYFSEHRSRPSSVGAFDWPQPKLGILATTHFHENESNQTRSSIPVAYPRFHDIYETAKVGKKSWTDY